MSNKMLIDASHPEETRVAVVRGNRIEEYDFESQEKKQLRGNIYLAKVTRVEPSLQAAFIDYGGNRHGFLAFSEIHPDYYQIPVADRQALLEAEAAEARAARESEEANDDIEAVESEDEASEEATAEKPEKEKKKPRRRRSKKTEAASDDAAEVDSGEDAGIETADAVEEADAVSTDKSPDDESEKPKKRTTRRRTSRKKADVEETTVEETEAQSEDGADSDTSDGDDKPTTMAAVIETDSISEPLPEDEGADREPEDTGDDQAEASSEEVEAPKKRRTSRSRRKPKKEAEEAATTEAETAEGDEASEVAADDADDSTDDAEEKPAKRKRRPRRRSRAKKDGAPDQDDSESDDENGSADDADASVESVGQEDALEEVPAPRRARRHYKIQEVIKRRQVLLVQVVKEERGTKGAALTTYLSLAGRYSVLMPNTARGGGISRKITNSADRKRLKAIAEELDVPNGMGVILRTAGASRTKDEINRDFEYLMRLWGQVRNLTLSSTAPCLVYEEGSLIKRSIRDLYDKDTGEIIVSGTAGFEEAKDFMTMLMPSHADKVKLHKDGQSIFAKYGVESHMEKMLSPQVTLKSGGYLIINQTEALVAVDVNSGRATREHSVEDTALQTNLEAAEEVARQLRLRDLAGLIVIDFIDMEERRNNRAVEKKLKECLKNDRARIQVGRISHFGLLEMSRQRMRASVLESTMDVCPHCAGTGYIRSDSAIALHVFRAIEEHVSRHNRFDCVVRANPSIAIHILNYKRAALWALEEKYGLHVIIEGDPEVQGQEFVIEKGERAQEQSGAAAIGYQADNEEASEAASAKDDSDGEGGKKRRNRRRRRKNRDEDRDNDVSGEEASESSEELGSDAEPSEDENSGKKRGRGRNTRRTKREETSEENKADAGDNGEAEQVVKADVTAAPSEEQEKPKRRSTVRRKAPVTPKSEAKADVDTKTEETKTETKSEEPPRPARRRTTRRKPDTQASAETTESEQNNGTGEATDQMTENAEDGAKKTGWWQRGGGFF